MPHDRRFGIVLKIDGTGWKKLSRLQKSLSVIGCMAVIILMSFIIYSAVSLPPAQNPTEFYILNAEGKAENYPKQIKIGEHFSVNAVVVNHENQSTEFKVRVINDGT